MFYLQNIKNLIESVKNNNELPSDDKEKAIKLLNELASLLALY